MLLQSYSLFSTTSSSTTANTKSYGKWYKNLGSQYGLIAMAQLSERLYVSIQPSIATHNFKYTGTYAWLNPQNTGEKTTLVYGHVQSLKYAEFPIVVREDITKGEFTPYVQAGAFYSFLQSGVQNVALTEVIGNGFTSNQVPEGTRSGSVTSQYIHTYLGLIVGGGISRKFDWAMVGLDLQYKRGLHNITNKANRYNNQSLLGDTFDVPDDISLNAWMISINVIFSLKGNKPEKGPVKCPI